MQPPLTGAGKTLLVSKQQITILLKNLVNIKMFRSNIYHKTRQSPLKARNTGG